MRQFHSKNVHAFHSSRWQAQVFNYRRWPYVQNRSNNISFIVALAEIDVGDGT